MMIIDHICCYVSDVSEEDQDKTTSTVHSKQSVGKSNLSISTVKMILELLSDEAVSKYAVTDSILAENLVSGMQLKAHKA